MRNNYLRKKGFTLIELLVAVSVFCVLSILLVSITLSIVATRKRVKNEQEGSVAVRALLDTMEKEIGSGVAFSSGCENGCNTLAFVTTVRPDTPSRRIDYEYDPVAKAIFRTEQRSFGACNQNHDQMPPECRIQMNPPTMVVNNAKFFVHNKDSGNQPIVVVALDVVVGARPKEQVDFQLSQSYTSRLPQAAGSATPNDTNPPNITILTPFNVSPGQTLTVTWPSPTITLTGTASDQSGVGAMYWKNDLFGTPNLITMNPPSGGTSVTWSIPNIPLEGGEVNTITVEGIDSDGNRGITTLIINSTAPAPAPVIYTLRDCSGSGPAINVYWPPLPKATNYNIERCDASGGACTASDSWVELGTSLCMYNGEYYNQDLRDDFNGGIWPSGNCSSGGFHVSNSIPGGPAYSVWSYRVRALKTTGSFSGYSNIDTQSQPDCPPTAPGPSPSPGPGPTPSPTPGGGGSIALSLSSNYVSIGVSPSSPGGGSNSLSINGISGSVSVSVTPPGNGISVSLSSTNVLAPGSVGISIFVPPSTPFGDYPVGVSANSGSASGSTGFIVHVGPTQGGSN
jgi:prepilin-type N-terminal cleavage/methylation domain-containing protein